MTSRQFYRVCKEHDTDFEALAEKYRKKAAKSQDLEKPLCIIAALVLFILSVIFFLQDPDSWGPGMLLIMPACGIGLGKWISGRVCKYYQKKYHNAEAHIFHVRQTSREEPHEVVPCNDLPPIPAFLQRPEDAFSERFFGKDMVMVKSQTCRYAVEIYGEVAGKTPKKIKDGSFPINERHVYSKKGENAWYVVQTLKAPSVRTSPLQNSVYAPYMFSKDYQNPEIFLALPRGKSWEGYDSLDLRFMGYYERYTQQKGLDESLVFCHIFRLGDELYKDLILCARKEDYSWRLETIIPTKHREILPPDYVFAGYFFSSFQIL